MPFSKHVQVTQPGLSLIAFSFDTNNTDDPDGILDPGGCVSSITESGGVFTVTLAAGVRLSQLVAHTCSVDDITIKACVTGYTASTGVLTVSVGRDDGAAIAEATTDKKVSVWLFGPTLTSLNS